MSTARQARAAAVESGSFLSALWQAEKEGSNGNHREPGAGGFGGVCARRTSALKVYQWFAKEFPDLDGEELKSWLAEILEIESEQLTEAKRLAS